MEYLPDDVLDAALQVVIDRADRITYTETGADDYADATTQKGSGGSMLAENDVTAGDFALADAEQDGSKGRRLAFKFRQFTALSAGTHDHVALVDDDASELVEVQPTQDAVEITEEDVGFAFNQDSVDLLSITA